MVSLRKFATFVGLASLLVMAFSLGGYVVMLPTKKITVVHESSYSRTTWYSYGVQKNRTYPNGFLTDVPVIFTVTPTGARLEQKADLTRLSYTLKHVPNLHWIVVEDSPNKTKSVASVLDASKMSFTHLNVPTPSTITKTRGLVQRNAGIDWIRKYGREPGVVYFADDDNTYDLRLFEEMRYTVNISVWPVAFVAFQKYEGPICNNGKVTGWYTVFKRSFGIDMAGFAVNLRLLLERSEARFHNKVGWMEPDFIEQFKLGLNDLEPKANCSQILVWHTRTQKSSLTNEDKLYKMFGRNNSHLEV